jgi:iron complex transport system ATP-binding protein
MIKATGLSLTLQGRQVLKEISLVLKPGELTLMIGPNGAGKSSLIRILAGLIPPDAGILTFEDRLSHTLNRLDRAQKVAFLPQDNVYAWAVRVWDVVALGRIPYGEDPACLPSKGGKAVHNALETLDLLSFKDRLITELSTGERARVFLARALASVAPVLLVDEPIAALDPAHALSVLKVLQDYARTGRSVLAILHDLPLAALFADHLLVLSRGRLVRNGAPLDILTKNLIRDVFQIEACLEKKNGRLRVLMGKPD